MDPFHQDICWVLWLMIKLDDINIMLQLPTPLCFQASAKLGLTSFECLEHSQQHEAQGLPAQAAAKLQVPPLVGRRLPYCHLFSHLARLNKEVSTGTND